MKTLVNAREAKEFLVSRIVLEAQLEGVPLSDIERKELYFSETDWTLPDMLEINAEFESKYDQNDYESKIAELIRNAKQRDRKTDPDATRQWAEAIGILRRQDHYILVMIGQAGISTRPPHDSLKLFLTGLAIAALLVGSFLLADYWHLNMNREALDFYLWTAAVGVVTFYVLLFFVLGRQRTNRLIGRVVDRAVTLFGRTR